MSLATLVSRHRRSMLFLLAVCTLGGILSAFSLPVALFPHVEFPRVAVSLDAGDRPALQMMTDITRPSEQAVKSVPGVQEVRSTTSRGSAELSMNFDWGGDMDIATLQIQAALTRLLPTLPQGVNFDVRRMNPTALYPVSAYALTSDTLDGARIREIAQNEVAPVLSSLPGVATADVMGGDVREVHVDADPDLLAAYGLSMNDVVKALSSDNIFSVAGRLQDLHKLFLVLSDTQSKTPEEIGQIVVKSGPDGVVELRDVATVAYGVEQRTSIVKADGKPAVILQVFQRPDGNTVQIVREVSDAIRAEQAKLPKSLKFSPWYDQSELIVASAKSVRDCILIGVLLAAATLFVFLRDGGITLAAAITVPATLAVVCLILKLLGMTFNIMTLGGMAAAIGLIIDDAIVMIEQIARHVHGTRRDRETSIRDAAQSFLEPLGGSSASTIIIFLPLAFLSGVTGAFFKSLALTMAASLVVSFFIAWFVIPLLASHLLAHKESDHQGRIMDFVLARYRSLSARTLRTPVLVLIPLALFVALGFIAYRNVGSGFMPPMDEGGFILDYVAPPGTSLADTDAMLAQIDEILKGTPEVRTWTRRTGAQLGGGLTEANTGDFFVRLKSGKRRPIDDIMNDLRNEIHARVPGLDIDMAQLMEDMIGDLTSVPQPIEIKLYSDDNAQLLKTAPEVAEAIGKIPGVVDVFNGIVYAGDAVDVKIDAVRAGMEGLTPKDVADQLQAYLSGTIASGIQTDVRTINVRAWVPAGVRSSIPAISKLPLALPDGHKIPLSRVAEIHLLTGQPEITRDNLRTMVAVTGRIEGRDLGSTIVDVRKVLGQKALLPANVSYTLGGLYEQQQIAFHDLMIVLVAAFALVFLLLLVLYENFSTALSIIVMPLLAMGATLVGLWVTGTELNISAMMGMTMVVGIVTEVAIFFFSEYKLVSQETGRRDAETLTRAGLSRFRPILMTTVAAVLALMPLALNIGQGAAMQRPLAIAIISGLVVQIPLVLLVMPGLYTLLSGVSMRFGRRKKGDSKAAGG